MQGRALAEIVETGLSTTLYRVVRLRLGDLIQRIWGVFSMSPTEQPATKARISAAASASIANDFRRSIMAGADASDVTLV